MIESTAFFLSAAYLASLQSYLDKQSWISFLSAIFFGVSAILVKCTTFYGFVLFSSGLIIRNWWIAYRLKFTLKIILRYSLCFLFALIPLIFLLWWVHFSDSLKSLNNLGAHLTAWHLRTWNFGTWSLRTSTIFWHTMATRITLSIGYGWLLFLLLPFLKIKSTNVLFACFSFIIFLATTLTFSNLYIVHEYYSYENAIFLIISVTFILYHLLEKGFKTIFVIGLIFLLISQIHIYNQHSRPFAVLDTYHTRDYQVGLFLRKNTKPNDFILIYGNLWSSSIAYYAERKSLTDPLWGDYLSRLKNLKYEAGGKKLGAIVICPSHKNNIIKNKSALSLINKYSKNFKNTTVFGCDIRYH